MKFMITVEYENRLIGQMQTADSPIDAMEKLTRMYVNGSKYKVEEELHNVNVDVTEKFSPVFHFKVKG